MTWILIAGALCLSSHHDICIQKNKAGSMYPFTLEWPYGQEESFFLQPLKLEAENYARDMDEFVPKD